MAIYTSILTAGTNSHAETSENVNGIATDFVSQGVIGAITNTAGVAPTTGAFGVNAQGTPNMTVSVNSGVAYVIATPASQDSQTLRVRSTTTQTVTISANTSGATKYDWLYISIDPSKAANPAVDTSDVATLVTSRSSLSTSDNGTPPAYGYCIAVITVSNGASSITNSNITDKRGGGLLSASALYNPYKFSVYASGSTSLTPSTLVKIALNTKNFDTGSNFDSVTNYRFTAPVAGFYWLNGQVQIGNAGIGSSAYGFTALYKNGTEVRRGPQLSGSGNSNTILNLGVSAFLQLAANDYIELFAVCSDSPARSTGGGNSVTFLDGFLVSAT